MMMMSLVSNTFVSQLHCQWNPKTPEKFKHRVQYFIM